MINPDIFEFTGYINDINLEYTEVLMTTDSEGNYRGAYTYAKGERISVEDLGQVEGVPNDPLYYLYDALGTTAAITNMNAGIIDNNRFAPFGEPLSPVAKNSRLTNSPWGYTGESHDIEASLVYLRARYYEPGTGRFIQQDTYPYFGEIEEPLTRNLYAYGVNNPLQYIDPNGHYVIGIAVELQAAAGIGIYGNVGLFVDDDFNIMLTATLGGQFQVNVSASASIVGFNDPKLKNVDKLLGWSGSLNIEGGVGIIGGASIGFNMNGEDLRVSGYVSKIGLGASIIPISYSIRIGYTFKLAKLNLLELMDFEVGKIKTVSLAGFSVRVARTNSGLEFMIGSYNIGITVSDNGINMKIID
jgi:RHS repeat-associated protein